MGRTDRNWGGLAMVPKNSLLKELVGGFFLVTGVAALARKLLWRDRVAILLYHNPDAATLDGHLTHLRKICDVVPLAALDQPSTGRPRAVITLDDGHGGNADL